MGNGYLERRKLSNVLALFFSWIGILNCGMFSFSFVHTGRGRVGEGDTK